MSAHNRADSSSSSCVILVNPGHLVTHVGTGFCVLAGGHVLCVVDLAAVERTPIRKYQGDKSPSRAVFALEKNGRQTIFSLYTIIFKTEEHST